jgi:hypothetical protein
MAKKIKTPKSGAERQAAYRARRADMQDKARLDIFIEFQTKGRIERIIKHYDMTTAALLEEWARKEEHKILNKMTPAQQTEYYTQSSKI